MMRINPMLASRPSTRTEARCGSKASKSTANTIQLATRSMSYATDGSPSAGYEDLIIAEFLTLCIRKANIGPVLHIGYPQMINVTTLAKGR
jgi:hypothetical protein